VYRHRNRISEVWKLYCIYPTVVSRSSRYSGHDRRVRCICYYETRPFLLLGERRKISLTPTTRVQFRQHISDLRPKFALTPHRVWKHGRHPICDRWD